MRHALMASVSRCHAISPTQFHSAWRKRSMMPSKDGHGSCVCQDQKTVEPQRLQAVGIPQEMNDWCATPARIQCTCFSVIVRGRFILPGQDTIDDAKQGWLSRLRGHDQETVEPQPLHIVETYKRYEEHVRNACMPSIYSSHAESIRKISC